MEYLICTRNGQLYCLFTFSCLFSYIAFLGHKCRHNKHCELLGWMVSRWVGPKGVRGIWGRGLALPSWLWAWIAMWKERDIELCYFFCNCCFYCNWKHLSAVCKNFGIDVNILWDIMVKYCRLFIIIANCHAYSSCEGLCKSIIFITEVSFKLWGDMGSQHKLHKILFGWVWVHLNELMLHDFEFWLTAIVMV